MKNILFFIWQLPQNILGLIIVLITRAKHESDLGFYCTYRFGWFGVSLGHYIIFGGSPSKISINHEKGHQVQSKYLGCFYLIFIGLPSFIGNIVHRFIKYNYYAPYWEAWADRIAGIKRR